MDVPGQRIDQDLIDKIKTTRGRFTHTQAFAEQKKRNAAKALSRSGGADVGLGRRGGGGLTGGRSPGRPGPPGGSPGGGKTSPTGAR